tara:strand:+ start:2953 stop:3564 length:612 start_codon:yes stop_codon:yes gene_type:complete
MRLVAFGDSWTAGHGVETNSTYKEDATPPEFIQKLREQNSWPRWLSERLGIPYVNMGYCGFGNEFILNKIESCKDFLHKDDIIIVVFTYPFRYKKHNRLSPIELYKKFEDTLIGYNRFYFNAFYPLLDDNVSIKLPKNYINPKGTLSYILQVEELENGTSVWEYGSRSVWNDEKNYYEGDYHPNLNGYKVISEFMFNEIQKLL